MPDPQAPETFTRSKLDWAEKDSGDHARVLDVYRALLALRRARPELTNPWLTDQVVAVDEDARWIVVHRNTIRVACNLSDVTVEVPVTGEVLLAWGTPAVGATSTTVAAESFVVLAG